MQTLLCVAPYCSLCHAVLHKREEERTRLRATVTSALQPPCEGPTLVCVDRVEMEGMVREVVLIPPEDWCARVIFFRIKRCVRKSCP